MPYKTIGMRSIYIYIYICDIDPTVVIKYFADSAGKKGGEFYTPKQINKLVGSISKKDGLTFFFQTQGKNQGREIAVDLLPHGLSILLELFGDNLISNLREKYSTSGYNCQFNYGEHEVVFNFYENQKSVKKMIIELDSRQFTRCQEGDGAKYQVFFHDSHTLKKFEVEVWLGFSSLCKGIHEAGFKFLTRRGTLKFFR